MTTTKTQLTDTGEKFGGARKDQDHSHLTHQSSGPDELSAVWPKPKFRKMMLDKTLHPEKGSYYQAVYKNLAKYPPKIDFVGVRRTEWPALWRSGILWIKASFESDTPFNIQNLRDAYDAYMHSLAPNRKDSKGLAVNACGKGSMNTVRYPFTFRGQNKALALTLWKLGYPFEPYISEKDGFCISELYMNSDHSFSNPFWQVMEGRGVKTYYTDDRTKYPSEAEAFNALKAFVEKVIETRRADDKNPKPKKTTSPVSPYSKRPQPDKTSVRIGPTNPKRVGDCTPQDLINGLGFRGVEFGNWVPNGERQRLLNDTYDAAFDLCSIVRVPAGFGSLWGRLGVAYGSRGRGAASAHYNTDKKLIHINRYPGVGSYAHEMGHAIDYFLSEHYGISNMVTKDAPLSHCYDEYVSSHNPEFHALMQQIIKRSPNYIRAARSNDIRRAGQYWASRRELFARAFESYVNDILKQNNRLNEFLVYGVENEEDSITWSQGVNPYPGGKEREAINELMNQFVRGSLHSIMMKIAESYESKTQS